MSITLLFVAVAGAVAFWWLWHQGLFGKPWLEEGAPSDLRGMSTTSLPPAKVGLWAFLAIVSALFVLLISAYTMRMPIGDWLPLPLPRILWFSTAMLVLGSIALYAAERSARQGWIEGMRAGVLAGGGTTLLFLIGQLLAWRQLMSEGYFLSANPANAFFYLMTALHGLHVAGGLVALGRTTARVWVDDDQVEMREASLSVELCATYWHFLLFVWLVLFFLLAGWGGEFLAICRQLLT
ncbi:cytochrome c oxidase subunit 3 [Hyphomicrobium sp. CS1GBMeth3]|uniref:cytochrome c oxidase subunit 3 n=1 Tax=Hyphomicrobium sp. CS1GBMeth3 TaxID=1892845 RepID=UPI0009313896|nr:cytochrome c oxidase subunit 3 [Hyphomicrobium sp. CS1GBMeth3]